MSFKIQCSKTADQQTVTIRQTDLTDISSLTTVTAKVYTENLATPVNEYVFSAGDLTNIKAGSVSLDSTTLLGSTDDEFYQVVLDGDTVDSESANVAMTLEVMGKALVNQGYIDVYSPSYRTDQVLHTVSFLMEEVNAIENQEASYQKRADYTSRIAILKKILNYE